MPAWPGPHLIRIHAHFTRAPFEAGLHAGTCLTHTRELRQRRLCQLYLTSTCRREGVMVAVAGVLLGGIARGAGLRGTVVRERVSGDHQPLYGSGALALDPCLHP